VASPSFLTLFVHCRYKKVRDLNSGTFGFVELAMDKTTGQQVAIKFIERGDKVRACMEDAAQQDAAKQPSPILSVLHAFYIPDLQEAFAKVAANPVTLFARSQSMWSGRSRTTAP
jgi:serine/threonine protein kinase